MKRLRNANPVLDRFTSTYFTFFRLPSGYRTLALKITGLLDLIAVPVQTPVLDQARSKFFEKDQI